MSNFTWRNAGLTDRGLVRGDNQDSFFIGHDGRVFVVADGVGGSQGGATASRIAVETVEEKWCQAKGLADDGLEGWMRETIAEANQRIRTAAEGDDSLHNMGTTIVMVVVGQDGNLHIGHAGDSRALLVRDSELDLLTMDHSVVMEMYLRGQLTLEQCRVSPYRHLITRCLGHDQIVEIDYKLVEPVPGDCFVLASDGLADVMRESEIGPLIGKCEGPQAVCDKLLENVLERGAPDNTTIVTIVCDQLPIS